MKTLEYYGSDTLKVFKEYYPGFDSLTDTEKEYINYITDFETIVYSIVDGEKIVIHDSLNGDIYSIDSLEKFFSETIKHISNEIGW